MEHTNDTQLTRNGFDDAYRRYYSSLYYYAYGFVEDAEACRDVVADAFGQAWTNVSRLTPATLKSYLYTCVRNKCIDYLRRTQAEKQYVESLTEVAEEDEGLTPEELEERLQTVEQLLEELPPKTRFVLEQCYYEHKKYQEVADILEVTTHAVKKHITKALSFLREHISAENR